MTKEELCLGGFMWDDNRGHSGVAADSDHVMAAESIWMSCLRQHT